METWKKWDDLIPQVLHNALQKVVNSYFVMPDIRMPITVHNFSKNTSSQLHIFVHASIAAMAAIAIFRTTHSQTSPPQALFLMGKCKVAPINQISVPKMALEAAVIGVQLLQLIQREMKMKFSQIFVWSESQVELNWIASKKKQNVFFSNRLQEIQKVSSPKQWHHIATCLNRADHGTHGLETKDIQQKWLEPPQFLRENESLWNEMNKPRATCAAATKISKTPVVDSSKFSIWKKILLTVATVFNVSYRAKTMQCQRTIFSTQLKTFNHQQNI